MGNLKKLASFYKSLFQLAKVDMSSMTQRILFQKAVYLAKEIGLGFDGYEFGWYVRGPYSPSLATDGYALYTSDEDHCTYRFREPELAKIGIIKKLFHKEIEAKDSNLLELYASILFCFDEAKTEDELLKVIKEKKGWYSEQEIREGIEKIKELKASAASFS